MRTFVTAALTLALAGGAHAQEAGNDPAPAASPDAGSPAAVSLSSIIAAIEVEDRFGRIEDVEWNRRGYWEIDYRRDDNARIEVEIDAATGQPRAED